MIIDSSILSEEWKIVSSILVLTALYLIRNLFIKAADRKIASLKRRYITRQIINYIVFFMAIMVSVLIWGRWYHSVWTFLSLVAAALIISSKEFILNLMANTVIIWRGLFHIGDRIQIGDYNGDVIETGPIFFTLAEVGTYTNTDLATGSVLKIPNMFVLTMPIKNFSRGLSLIYNEIEVDITIGSDWRKAKIILYEIISKYSYKFRKSDLRDIKIHHNDILFTRKDPAVFVRIKEGKIHYRLRYICKFNNRRDTETLIWEDILNRFDKDEKINLYKLTY